MLLRLAVAVMAVGVLSACRDEADDPPDRPLATILYRGGLCTYGVCSTEVRFLMDGTFTARQGDGAVRGGTVGRPAADRARSAVEAADFVGIRGRPFTGECPTAYDGQEVVYTFHLAGHDEVVSTCHADVDPGAEPFASVGSLLRLAGY